MKKNIILKSILIGMFLLLIYSTKSYCAESGTVRMKIDGGTPWTNINVSESYEECRSLNSATSTLGTTLLKAHLTTDADWSAMAIFSVSQYGGATNNTPKSTTGNETGIQDVGDKYTQTTGILETVKKDTTQYIGGLFNDDGTVKEYVRQWPADRKSTDFVGFNGTAGWLGASLEYGGSTASSISTKLGLFSCWMGAAASNIVGGQPNPRSYV